MKIVVLEGIATSGKSTVLTGLKTVLPSLKVEVVEEAVTHMPIIHKTSELHIKFFVDLINEEVGKGADLLVFDRLYISQAFRAKVELSAYNEVETLLLKYQPLTVYLEVDEVAIADRVGKAIQHRDAEWGDYVKTKGASIDEIASYYTEQQRNQLRLLKQSKVPYKVFNTTDHDYSGVVAKIADLIV